MQSICQRLSMRAWRNLEYAADLESAGFVPSRFESGCLHNRNFITKENNNEF